MKFILGLFFGITITFSSTWMLTLPAATGPAETTDAQDLPTQAPKQAEPMPSAPTGVEPLEVSSVAAMEKPVFETDVTEEAETTAEAQSTPGRQPIWTQFHSEASARGFANYLSSQTDHPFEVTRVGPARYQVSYLYDSTEQAQSLADRIRLITGSR
ncbi:MAG: hypothetical protein ACFHXK_17465 [bacterium]